MEEPDTDVQGKALECDSTAVIEQASRSSWVALWERVGTCSMTITA